jgi:general secretion pathway protein A
VNEARGKPSLADDPEFLADLDELDRGLTESRAPRKSPAARAAAPAGRPRAAPSPPASQSGVSFERGAPSEPPIVLQPGTRRPLLDLFPAPPSTAGRLPEPLARGTAAAPKLARPPRATALAEAPDAILEPPAEQTFYGFAEPAFALEPDLKFLFHSAEHDRTAQLIVEAIANRTPVSVVTGVTGVGKTLLCKAIPDQLDRRTLRSVILDPIASFDDLAQILLLDFGVLSREEVSSRAADTSELVNALRSFLAPLASLQANAAILIDEAQNVAPDVLASLHALAQSMSGTVQLVLVGQPSLLRTLAKPGLRAVNDAVTLRIEHGPLSSDEVPGYVMHRIHVAAAGPRLEFDDRAFAVLAEVSGGVPRIVNQICDRALTDASRASSTLVDASLVAAAADDLGMSPPPTARGTLRAVALVLAFLLLMSAGAGAAAWVFRDRIHRVLTQWQPPPPN